VDHVANLRALLKQPPSVQAFEQILALFDSWPGSTLQDGLAQAGAALERWPAETRCAGEALFTGDNATGELKPAAVLARKFALEPSEAGCDLSLVQLIAQAPELANLEVLDLLCEDIDSDGAIAITESSTLRNLRVLRLGDKIDDAGWSALAGARNLAKLEKLELRGWLSDEETAFELAASPLMAKLMDLELEVDGLSDEGYWALGMSEHIPPGIRRGFLEEMDAATLKDKARALGLGGAKGQSKRGLIKALLQRSARGAGSGAGED
jgi:hypothetical protein